METSSGSLWIHTLPTLRLNKLEGDFLPPQRGNSQERVCLSGFVIHLSCVSCYSQRTGFFHQPSPGYLLSPVARHQDLLQMGQQSSPHFIISCSVILHHSIVDHFLPMLLNCELLGAKTMTSVFSHLLASVMALDKWRLLNWNCLISEQDQWLIDSVDYARGVE